MWQAYITFSAKIKALWHRKKAASGKSRRWLISAAR
jgi:hypothetical protein